MLSKKEMDNVMEKYEDVLPSSMFRSGMLFVKREELAEILEKVASFFPTEEGYGDDPDARLHPGATALMTLAEQVHTGRIKITNLEERLEDQIKRLEGKKLYVASLDGTSTETSVVINGKFEYEGEGYGVESFDLNEVAACVHITELEDDTVVRITSNINRVFTLHTSRDKITFEHNKIIKSLIGSRVYHYDYDSDVVHCATVDPDCKIRLYIDGYSHSFDLHNPKTEIDIEYGDTIVSVVNEDDVLFCFHTNIQEAI